jgi:hypothetical protein
MFCTIFYEALTSQLLLFGWTYVAAISIILFWLAETCY